MVKILNRIGVVAYRVELPRDAKIHNVIHVSLLKRFVGDPSAIVQNFPTQFQGQMPLLLPENVLGRQTIQENGQWKKQLLVKWQGIPADEANWEYEDVLQHEFPTFNLEDKVASKGGGNDAQTTVLNDETTGQNSGAGKAATPARRGIRVRKVSRKFPYNEYDV